MKKLFAFAFSLQAFLAMAQFERLDGIVVIENGDTLSAPWAGGINSGQFSTIELNNDGNPDLFVFDRATNLSTTYLNAGILGEARFIHAPEYQDQFPELAHWALLRDFNCDGKKDIFTAMDNGQVAVWENTSTSSTISFDLVTDNLQYDGSTSILIAVEDLPDISDVDNDGDMDILTFVGSSRVTWYENTGGCSVSSFVVADICWGNFSEDENNNAVTLNDCANRGSKGQRHAGSTLLSVDMDGDQDRELMLGDIAFEEVVFLQNGGTPADADMVSETHDFPNASNPIHFPLFPAAFLEDLNNDALPDIIAAPNNFSSSVNAESTWMYENTGTASNYQFSLVKKNWMQDQMIELGSGSQPVFFDHNADGLMDLVIGNAGYFENGFFKARLALYENIGTATQPAFELVSRDYANTSILQRSFVYPAFGDLDGDGDLDMLVGGGETRELAFFENTAGAGNTANFTLSDAIYQDLNPRRYATLQITDVNGDGLPDLLMGERSGLLAYYENEGTATSPVFSFVPTDGSFGGIDVRETCCTGYSVPYFTRDKNGNPALFVASEDGEIFLYSFFGLEVIAETSYHVAHFRPAISGADINGDGQEDFAIGNFAGGLALYSLDYEVTGISEGNAAQEVSVYPNPVTNLLHIEWEKTRQFEVMLYDMAGRKIISKNSSGPQYSLEMEQVEHGTYILHVESKGSVHRQLVEVID